MRKLFSIRPISLLLASVIAVSFLVLLGPIKGALETGSGRQASAIQGPYPVLQPPPAININEPQPLAASIEPCATAATGVPGCGESKAYDFYIREVSDLSFPENVDSNSPSIRVDGGSWCLTRRPATPIAAAETLSPTSTRSKR